jgi:ubiquinone biosynthesis protein
VTPADLATGAWSDAAPWRVERESLVWREGVEELRASTQDEVPRLARPRRVPPLLRFFEAAWRLGIPLLAWWLRERGREGATLALSLRLRKAFEKLGPAYIKLGQIVSSGRGIFPDEVVSEFKLLRDRVAPEPFEDVRRVVEADLGRPLEEVFAEFDRECLASASIAQVHAARLVSGERVVVKVQRPRVAELVRLDIAAMAWIAPHLVGRIPIAALANPPALVELFTETILEELDFRLEAENMLDVAGVLAHARQHIVVVPRPHPRLVTRRVLVMERLEGFQYEDVEGMRAAGIDTGALLRELLIAFLEGAMIYGVFHGDLHGGNLFVMPDGRVALLDYGITGRLEEPKRIAFLRMLMTGAVRDLRGQIAAFRDLGALPADVDVDAVIRDLKLDQPVKDPTQLSAEELSGEIRIAIKSLLAHGAKLPKPLMLYAKDMLFFDSATAALAPDVNMFGEFVRIYGWFAERYGEKILRDVGFDPRGAELDVEGIKAGMGLTAEVDSITHRELQERRGVMQKKMEEVREKGLLKPGADL